MHWGQSKPSSGHIPKHPSCLIPSGSHQPLRMMYGQAQRKGKWRLERGLRKCDNSSALQGQAGAGRLVQGVTVMVIKVLPAPLHCQGYYRGAGRSFLPSVTWGSRGPRPCFGGKSGCAGWLPTSQLSAPLSQRTAG